MIRIRKSATADTRTCDWSKVDKETLLQSSQQHITDVWEGFQFLRRMLSQAARNHDHDKITGIDHFHSDFKTGFKETGWYDNHVKVNRHHLTHPEGVPEDVNLIDVLEMIVDCTMAGMARSGDICPIEIDGEVLKRAVNNTTELLKREIEVAGE